MQEKRTQAPAYIHIFANVKTHRGFVTRAEFDFYLSGMKTSGKEGFLKSIRIPEHMRKDTNELKGTGYQKLRLGNILYLFSRLPHVAVSSRYQPKDLIGQNKAKGLGYLLELECLKHLKAKGVTHVSTTGTPSEPRLTQLDRVGLWSNHATKIEDWISAMREGYGRARLKHSPAYITLYKYDHNGVDGPRTKYAIFAHRGAHRAEYEMDAKHAVNERKGRETFTRVKTMIAPAHLQGELLGMLEKQHFSPVGHIDYSMKGNTAVASDYKPKMHVEPQDVKGFGYFVERHALADLQGIGATHVRTTNIMSPALENMVTSVGLPLRTSVPIAHWRSRLNVGIKGAARKYGRKD